MTGDSFALIDRSTMRYFGFGRLGAVVPSKRLVLTNHVRDRLKQRAIDEAEIHYAFDHVIMEFPGKNPGTRRIIADMALGRRLGVVYKQPSENLIVVITAYWVEGQP